MHGGTSGIDGLFQDEHIAGSMLHRAGRAEPEEHVHAQALSI
jgi:hypothetical protein